MDLSSELRAVLWATRDWRQSLEALARRIQASKASAEATGPSLQLALALENIEPDRHAAVSMYLVAWNARPGIADVLPRARALCREIGDLEMAARVARVERDHSGDATLAVAEGVAYLDANQPDRALEPLRAARVSLGDDPSLLIALGTATQSWSDPRQPVKTLLAEAEGLQGRPAADRFLAAARIVRISGFEGTDYAQLLWRALRANPADQSALGLLENWLVMRDDRDGLLELYRYRSRSCTGLAELVEEYRRAGTKLLLAGRHTGLGLQLIEKALSTAYGATLETIPGHLAMLSLVRRYTEESNLHTHLLELIAKGLQHQTVADDRLWLAMTGLEVAWKHLDDSDSSRAYAAIIAEIAPEHPLLQEFCVANGIVEENWADAPPDDDAVFLDQWITGADGVIQQRWTQHEKVGLAAAIPTEVAEEPKDEPEPMVADHAKPLPNPAELPDAELVLLEPEPGPNRGTRRGEPEPDEDIDIDIDIDEEEPEPGPHRGTRRGAKPEPEPEPEPAKKPRPISIIPRAAQMALSAFRNASLVPSGHAPSAPKDRAQRAIFPADIRIMDSGSGNEARTINAITRDLSATGLFIVTDVTVEIGTIVLIELELPGGDPWSLTDVELTARVVRCGDNGFGVVLVDPPQAAVDRLTALSEQA